MINNLENNITAKNLKCPCCNEGYFREDFENVFNEFLNKLDDSKDKIHYVEGFRCSYYNEQMDGDKNSPHLFGYAIDFHFDNKENILNIYNIAKMYFSRIGLYINHNKKTYMHVDMDETRGYLYWVKYNNQYLYFKTYVDFENWINVQFKDLKI